MEPELGSSMEFTILCSLNSIPNAENESSRGESVVIPPYNDRHDRSISIGSSLQRFGIVEPTSSVSSGVVSNAVPISSYLVSSIFNEALLPDVHNSTAISENEVEQAYHTIYQVPSRDRRVGIALIVSLGFENNEVERYQAADEETELVETLTILSSDLDIPLSVGSLPDVPNSRAISESAAEDSYGSPDRDDEIMSIHDIKDSVSIENEYYEVEQAYQSIDNSIYYQVPSGDRRVGIALIVSLGFENEVERYQAADEEEELVATFKLLNYKTIRRAHNRTLLDELRDVINEVDDNDGSFVCCISSYGGCNSESGKEYIVDFDGTHVYCLQDVAVEIFSNCEKLERKPKMFFIQACRGPRRDQLQTVQVPARTLRFGPVPPWDFLFAYSTGPGCLSFRPELHGFKPYFFPILCQKLRDYYKEFDVVTILQMVNKEYSNYYQPKCNGETVRQVSWSNSSLRGLVFICADALYSHL